MDKDLNRPYNTVIWLIGPDDAPTAIEYEQSDGKVYLLCNLSETDATGLGYFTASAARAMGVVMHQSLTSRRT